MDAKKKQLYQYLKIAGMCLYVPIILAVYPSSMYFLGIWIVNRFKLPFWILYIAIFAGFILAAFEVIKLLSRMNK